MKLIDTYQPTKLSQIIGNKQAVSKIERSILMNNGLGGLVFMLTGKTGNGKTLIADIIAENGNHEVYRPDCTKDAETATFIDMLKQDIYSRPLLADQYVYIFDEADKLSVNNITKLKTTIDAIDRRRRQELPCYVTVIFTSAKRKDELSDGQKKHWDELVTRCITCELKITPEEINEFFDYVTMGHIQNISRYINQRIGVISMRAAWDYIEEHDIPIAG